MGVDVYLVDEMGTLVEGTEPVFDVKNKLVRLMPLDNQDFQCLRFVDPYCDTIFNHRQMEQFLEELDRILISAQDDEDKALIRKVRQLAVLCQAEYHHYLKFVGD